MSEETVQDRLALSWVVKKDSISDEEIANQIKQALDNYDSDVYVTHVDVYDKTEESNWNQGGSNE